MQLLSIDANVSHLQNAFPHDDTYGHLQLKSVSQTHAFKDLVNSRIFPGQGFPGQITANTPYPHYTLLSSMLVTGHK